MDLLLPRVSVQFLGRGLKVLDFSNKPFPLEEGALLQTFLAVWSPSSVSNQGHASSLGSGTIFEYRVSQGAQYGLTKENSLNHVMDPHFI